MHFKEIKKTNDLGYNFHMFNKLILF
jgi:hypothetical protein